MQSWLSGGIGAGVGALVGLSTTAIVRELRPHKTALVGAGAVLGAIVGVAIASATSNAVKAAAPGGPRMTGAIPTDAPPTATDVSGLPPGSIVARFKGVPDNVPTTAVVDHPTGTAHVAVTLAAA